MNIDLIKGKFNSAEALDIIAQMVSVKIKYHEDKINNTTSEEDIKYRESRIKNLQRELSEVRRQLKENNSIKLEATIFLNNN